MIELPPLPPSYVSQDVPPSQSSSDPVLPGLDGDLSSVLKKLLLIQEYNINNPDVFKAEYGLILGNIANYIQDIYSDLCNITDPNILKSKAYANLMKDLTEPRGGFPSLIDAANEGDLTDLASGLCYMNDYQSGSLLTGFEGDISTFLREFQPS